MLTPAENEILCRIENNAPMGQIMRRHWLPICMGEEVAEADGAPVRARLLGEDLVVFRDSKGRLGTLGERCPHRGASLAFGRNEECGLRCVYHGWKFDVEGNVVGMMCEPPSSQIGNSLKHKSYPTHEAGNLVWVYMGPRETMPPFQAPVFAPSPDTRISITKVHTACNWAQAAEGSLDSAHSSALHSTNSNGAVVAAADGYWKRPSNDASPRIQVQPTSFGFRYVAIRTPIENPDTHDYIRMTLFVAPYTVLIPPSGDQFYQSVLFIPIDDHNTMYYWIAWHPTKGIDQRSWRKFCGAEIGIDIDHNYRKIRTLDNWFMQDRTAMKRGDFSGIQGTTAQDMAMWESMGSIADRSQNYLGNSDLAVAQFRRQMVAAAKGVAKNGALAGESEPRIPDVKLTTFEGIVPKGINWRTLAVSDEEQALTRKSTKEALEDVKAQ